MGTLFIVSTPIGNLEDISIRAIRTLFSVDIIACEDTRRTGILLLELKKRYTSFISPISPLATNSRHGVFLSPKLESLYEGVEIQRTPSIIQSLEQGKSVALVSDAGTPLVNDPGFLLVRECLKRGIKVVSIPGPSALLAALTTSGLPTDKFMFLGYPPEKKSHRIKLFQNLLSINRLIDSSYIFYCAPHKLLTTLEDMKGVLGDMDISICRELTKVHEECWRGKISEAVEKFASIKGEVVVLLRLYDYERKSGSSTQNIYW